MTDQKPDQKSGQSDGKKLVKTIRDFELRNQTVFLRLDLNVPLGDADEGGCRRILDDNRIAQALPTLKYAIEQGAKVVVASHLGRPKGAGYELRHPGGTVTLDDEAAKLLYVVPVTA